MVEAQGPTREAGANQSAPEREVVDFAVPEAEMTRRVPEAEVTQRARDAGERGDGHPKGSEVPLTGTGLATSHAMTVRIPLRPRQARVAFEMRPVETRPASSQEADAGATSSAPPGCMLLTGTAALNLAMQDVMDKFSADGAALL